MHIPQNIQIVILFALDEYIKLIKTDKRKKELMFSMAVLEDNNTEEVSHGLSDYITSLKYYYSHSNKFWRAECQNALNHFKKYGKC